MKAILLWLALAGAAAGGDILAFTRPRCGPCERLKADLANNPQLVDPHALHLFDANSELARSYGITTVPTFIKVENGREVGRKVGYRGPKDLRDWASRR